MSSRISPRPLESYPAAVVYDCRGRKHRSPALRWNGVRVYVPAPFQHPDDGAERDPREAEADAHAEHHRRCALLDLMYRSGRFTKIEMRTLHALVVDGRTLTEIARLDGCSRQAVVARVTGSTAGHGGILRKLRELNLLSVMRSHEAA